MRLENGLTVIYSSIIIRCDIYSSFSFINRSARWEYPKVHDGLIVGLKYTGTGIAQKMPGT